MRTTSNNGQRKDTRIRIHTTSIPLTYESITATHRLAYKRIHTRQVQHRQMWISGIFRFFFSFFLPFQEKHLLNYPLETYSRGLSVKQGEIKENRNSQYVNYSSHKEL